MSINSIPFEFMIFGVTLLGVALFYRRALLVALLGLISATLLQIFGGAGAVSTAAHEIIVHFASRRREMEATRR